ncbi:MAG TPA: hypothetical protein VFW79_04070 [Cellulomonas sp.]|uniref:hypothetical protein n=1 Tax=Cellulomonas sp. TaxID=40001 RepID=UPI002E36BA94|nr:hypothetical protein [Cellulomonas sp.]HEX5331798.1 hypothetical protein [Cellulomonas sp.]
MTIDLARTLHDAVDGTGTTYLLGHAGPQQDTVAETVGHLATRIRTRRAVRAGTRAGVGLVTVGAIAAFGGQLVGRRGADDLLPAAVPGAAPGTCGSSVADLVATGGADWTASLVFVGNGSGLVAADVPLGPFVGRHLPAFSSLPTATDAAGGAGATVSASPDGTTQIVVAHDGTVVAVLPVSQELPMVVTDRQAGFALPVGGGSVPDLVTCATGRSAGGEDLPAGTYSAYTVAQHPDASVPGGVARAVGARIPLTLLPTAPPMSGLPAAFPADVPIIGGRLVEATQLDGSLASGWIVTVAVDGTDGFTRAVDALDQYSPTWRAISSTASPDDSVGAIIGRWDVTVRSGLTADGQSTVIYRLTPM